VDDSNAQSGAPGTLPTLAAAIAAFLRGAPPPGPYRSVPAGTYIALCTLPEAAGAGDAQGSAAVVLLAAEDGALYAPAAAGAPLQDALHAQRLRPTTTTLTLRLPDDLVGTPARPARFILWASPAYLAAGGASGEIWK
jgi:hypothetical protein